jgi:hypothetical protein
VQVIADSPYPIDLVIFLDNNNVNFIMNIIMVDLTVTEPKEIGIKATLQRQAIFKLLNGNR